jgi:hypothetical protein
MLFRFCYPSLRECHSLLGRLRLSREKALWCMSRAFSFFIPRLAVAGDRSAHPSRLLHVRHDRMIREANDTFVLFAPILLKPL